MSHWDSHKGNWKWPTLPNCFTVNEFNRKKGAVTFLKVLMKPEVLPVMTGSQKCHQKIAIYDLVVKMSLLAMIWQFLIELRFILLKTG